MLARQIERLRRRHRLDEIVVATTTNRTDDSVIGIAESCDARWFRGSEHDVLDRYVRAARDVRADIVARITADCPLIDPEVSDGVVEAIEARAGSCDYAANMLDRTYPERRETEALFADVLERTHRLARSAAAREHVTWYIHSEEPDLFLIHSVRNGGNESDLRWTADTQADLDRVRRIYDALSLDERWVPYRDRIEFVRSHPEITESRSSATGGS